MIDIPPRIGVVLVNWNRWADTLECLESLTRSAVPLAIVVVDNGSTDGSLERIAAWAEGTQAATATDAAMAHFSQPAAPKPIGCQQLHAAQLPAFAPGAPPSIARLPTLTLIDAGANLGFAGGNNLGLRLLLATGIDYYWLLNNDTVADPRAAEAVLARMDATHRIGMCGTVVRYYHTPSKVQSLNGSRFSYLTGQSRSFGSGKTMRTPFSAQHIATHTDFVLGASLAVSRAFVEHIGLMEERYFLYFEEIDWSARNRGRYVTAFAHGATIYHKEGGSIGSSSVAGQRSSTAEYWLTRSRLAFIRKHRPVLLPLHWALSLALIGRRILRRQPSKAAAMLRALAGVKY